MRHGTKDSIEIAVAPHPAREGWRVLRITYARRPEHERRVARALDALVAPADGGAPRSPEERAGREVDRVGPA
jgi:hypothetical protein